MIPALPQYHHGGTVALWSNFFLWAFAPSHNFLFRFLATLRAWIWIQETYTNATCLIVWCSFAIVHKQFSTKTKEIILINCISSFHAEERRCLGLVFSSAPWETCCVVRSAAERQRWQCAHIHLSFQHVSINGMTLPRKINDTRYKHWRVFRSLGQWSHFSFILWFREVLFWKHTKAILFFFVRLHGITKNTLNPFSKECKDLSAAEQLRTFDASKRSVTVLTYVPHTDPIPWEQKNSENKNVQSWNKWEDFVMTELFRGSYAATRNHCHCGKLLPFIEQACSESNPEGSAIAMHGSALLLPLKIHCLISSAARSFRKRCAVSKKTVKLKKAGTKTPQIWFWGISRLKKRKI